MEKVSFESGVLEGRKYLSRAESYFSWSKAKKYFSRFWLCRCRAYRIQMSMLSTAAWFVFAVVVAAAAELAWSVLMISSGDMCKFSWFGSTARLDSNIFRAHLLRLRPRLTGSVPIPAGNRRLWNNSFTCTITFHSVSLILRLKPKNLRSVDNRNFIKDAHFYHALTVVCYPCFIVAVQPWL